MTFLQPVPKLIGVAADHGGYELKDKLADSLRENGYEVVDFGDGQPKPDDDYPDFVEPLARAVASGRVDRGVAICGSGVGACVVANKVPGVRACLIHETFSARQGVEDDDLNVICLGGLVVSHAVAWARYDISSCEIQRRRTPPSALGKNYRFGAKDELAYPTVRHADETTASAVSN